MNLCEKKKELTILINFNYCRLICLLLFAITFQRFYKFQRIFFICLASMRLIELQHQTSNMEHEIEQNKPEYAQEEGNRSKLLETRQLKRLSE